MPKAVQPLDVTDNIYYVYRNLSHRNLADLIAKLKKEQQVVKNEVVEAERLFHLMEEETNGDERWFTSLDPLVLALKQLKLGPDKQILTDKTLSVCLMALLDLKERPSNFTMKRNWEDYYSDVREFGGDKTYEILGEQKVTQEELDDLLKIRI